MKSLWQAFTLVYNYYLSDNWMIAMGLEEVLTSQYQLCIKGWVVWVW